MVSSSNTNHSASLALGRILIGLWITAAVLVTIHVVLNLIHYRVTDLPWLARQIFDVDEEDSFPTWFSAMLLLLTSVSLALQSFAAKQNKNALAGQWGVLAVGFLFLSIDEIAGMHETLNSLIEISWTIPGGIGAGLVGLYFIPFLLKIPRPLAVKFVIAGAIYLGGALGVEVLTDPYLENDALNTLAYNLWTAVEEAMEMGGVLFFLGGVFSVLRDNLGELKLQFK